jgi:hypothetical protein
LPSANKNKKNIADLFTIFIKLTKGSFEEKRK